MHRQTANTNALDESFMEWTHVGTPLESTGHAAATSSPTSEYSLTPPSASSESSCDTAKADPAVTLLSPYVHRPYGFRAISSKPSPAFPTEDDDDGLRGWFDINVVPRRRTLKRQSLAPTQKSSDPSQAHNQGPVQLVDEGTQRQQLQYQPGRYSESEIVNKYLQDHLELIMPPMLDDPVLTQYQRITASPLVTDGPFHVDVSQCSFECGPVTLLWLVHHLSGVRPEHCQKLRGGQFKLYFATAQNARRCASLLNCRLLFDVIGVSLRYPQWARSSLPRQE